MEKKRRLPVLSIVSVGTTEFPRYLISDERDRRWTGHDFGETGVLYGGHNDACIDTQKILRSHFDGTEPVRYVVPLIVEVFSDQPVPVAKVAQHLSLTSRLSLNTPKYGNGPNNSLVLPWIEWHRIEEHKGGPNDE